MANSSSKRTWRTRWAATPGASSRRLVRMRDPGLAAVVRARFHQFDFAGLRSHRERQRLDLARQVVDVQVGEQMRIVSGIGLERHDLRRQFFGREQHAVDSGIGADVEKIIGLPGVADAGQVFELLAFPDSEQRDGAVDQICHADDEIRALGGNHEIAIAEPRHCVAIGLARGQFDPADRKSEITASHGIDIS